MIFALECGTDAWCLQNNGIKHSLERAAARERYTGIADNEKDANSQLKLPLSETCVEVKLEE